MKERVRGRWSTALAVVAVTMLALFLRWDFVVTAQVNNPFRGDALQYYSYAWNMLNHHVFSMAKPGSDIILPDSFRQPGYPLLMAVWMWITDDTDRLYAGVVLTQVVLGALTAGMTVMVGRLWMPIGWSACAGFLAAVWPHNVAISAYLLSEPLYGFFLMLAMLLYGAMLRRSNLVLAVAAGSAFGFAFLVNPMLLPLCIVLASLASWQKDAPKKLLATFILAVLAFPAAWGLRNAATPPTSAGTSTDRALLNLEQGSWPAYHSAWRMANGSEPDSARDLSAESRDVRMNAGRTTMALMGHEEQLMNRSPREGLSAMATRFADLPWVYAKWYLVEKPMLLWSWGIRIGQGDVYINPTRNSPLETMPLRVLTAICHGLNPVGGIAAFLSAFLLIVVKHQQIVVISGLIQSSLAMARAVAWLFMLVTLAHTVLQSEPRYAIPYRPFEFLLAVTLIAALVRVCLWRRSSRLPGVGGPHGYS